MARLQVNVHPGARRNRIAGWHDNALKIDVDAPPDRGRANAELVDFLADHVGLPRTRVQVIMGHSSRRKVIAFDGISEEELLHKFS